MEGDGTWGRDAFELRRLLQHKHVTLGGSSLDVLAWDSVCNMQRFKFACGITHGCGNAAVPAHVHGHRHTAL